MKNTLLGILGGMLFSLAFAAVIVPVITKNAIHRERMNAMEKGVGYYYLNQKIGAIDFQYMDLDAYTHYVLGQIQAGKPVPVNPHKDLQ